MDGILSPIFLQAACAHAQQSQNVIRLHIGDNPLFAPMFNMSCTGNVYATYIKNGIANTVNITDDPEMPEIPDANTDVTIRGDVTRFECSAPPNGSIVEIDATECKSLMSLSTSQSIEILKIGKYLTSLNIYGTSITSIYYPANNNSVSTEIADAITNADANDGTVYTKSDGTYYNTIADAATAKGWTIQELN